MVVAAAAAAVVLGVIGVVVVGIAAAAAVVVVVVVVAVVVVEVVVVEVEVAAAAAVEAVIESGFHVGICCGVTGFGYGSGMDRDTLSGPAFTLWLWRKRGGISMSSLVLHVAGRAATEGVVIIVPLEIQEAPSGTRTGLTSLQGTCNIASS